METAKDDQKSPLPTLQNKRMRGNGRNIKKSPKIAKNNQLGPKKPKLTQRFENMRKHRAHTGSKRLHRLRKNIDQEMITRPKMDQKFKNGPKKTPKLTQNFVEMGKH